MFLDPVLFFGFLAAATALIVTPGPIVTMVIATSLAHDARAGIMIVLGATASSVVMLVAAIAGLATAATALADWFPLIRIGGGLFLIWIGLQTFRAKRSSMSSADGARHPDGVYFRQGFTIGISNPKTIVFFAAFLARFISPKYPPLPQLLAMGAAFLVMGTLSDSIYALLAGKARAFLSGPRAQRNLAYLSGAVLMGLGALLVIGSGV